MPGGTRLGRYEVLRHLADGGMAELLLARSTGIEGFERHVVIKRIHADQARNKQHVDMFLDEARLAASLHHHNIVQVHDVGQENGEYFFAMEYVHGEDLRKILTHLAGQKLQLPLEHVVTIVAAAASGLHYAHEMKGPNGPLGIVHRDVSPANILVGYDGNVKVVDFGIAKAIARSADTQAGTLKGKAAYMAPEQCMGIAIDRRSDVFALGIVLWELLTVRRLFKGATEFATMTAIVSGKVARPSEHRKDLPKALEAIVMKALATMPQDRYQSCEELRLALEDFADLAGLRTSTTATGDYMVGQFGRRTEPWLVESDEPVIEVVDPDFDGSASASESVDVASVSIPQTVFDIQSSPIMKARARARTTGHPVFPTPVTGTKRVEEKKPTGNDSAGWGKPGDVPETGSGTPMAWTPSERLRAVSPPGSRRKRWLIGGAIATPLLIVGVLVLSRGHGAADTSTHVSSPAPAAAPAPVPPPAPPPVAEPPPPEPTPVAAPEPPSIKPPAEVAKPAKKHPQVKPKPAPSWDRNALFPK